MSVDGIHAFIDVGLMISHHFPERALVSITVIGIGTSQKSSPLPKRWSHTFRNSGSDIGVLWDEHFKCKISCHYHRGPIITQLLTSELTAPKLNVEARW
jgi:hypothetical protein